MRKVLVTLLAVVLMVGMLMSGCAKEVVPTEPISPTAPSPTTIEPPTTPTATTPTTPTTPTVTPPTTPAGEQVYSVLDPRSNQVPIPFQGLSPRLDTLEGKTVIVANCHGGNEESMEPVASQIMALVPTCNAIYLSTNSTRKINASEWDMITDADALILGHDY